MIELAGLGVTAFLSATLLPGSSEALLISLVLLGTENPLSLLVVATFGNVLGSLLNWYIGAFFMSFQHKKWFPVSPKHMDKAQAWFTKYGIWTLLLAWAPVIGDPLTIIAGMLRTPIIPFLILVTIGKFIRYALITAIALAWI
ncbi:MAG: DedA family protein [Sneathiella sp.]|nr:DedA family protein [Sneathiella sp.]